MESGGEMVTKYKVALPRGRWKMGFSSMVDAVEYANGIFRRTGNLVAVETYQGRSRESEAIGKGE